MNVVLRDEYLKDFIAPAELEALRAPLEKAHDMIVNRERPRK